MNQLEAKLVELLTTKSDINEHLLTLVKYASECENVTEFGVRYGASTIALLSGKPKKMVSYDINEAFDSRKWKEIVKEETDFAFIKADVLNIEIEETDLLFIDTIHNFRQLTKELELHANKVKKYLIFHDTTSFEWRGESYVGEAEIGIWPAIDNFLKSNPHWSIKERYTNNNGLTILVRSQS